MTTIDVYHNPNFLHYRGNHAQIAPPVAPVALVTVSGDLPETAALSRAFALTQHIERPWYAHPDAQPRLRSTSVGDVLAIGDAFYVVEPLGFKPYAPRAIRPVHRLAEACRRLEAAVSAGSRAQLQAETTRALAGLRHVLATEGYPVGETPVLWGDAGPGDLVGGPQKEQYRVIVRRLRPKWRARRLLECVPEGEIWIDSPRTWAVVAPVVSH